jgi:hypothetical protein
VGLDGRAAGVVFLLCALGLMTLVAYCSTGKRTVRRQVAVFVLAAAALVVVALAVPLLSRSFGWGWIGALLVVNVLTVFAMGRQIAGARSTTGPPVRPTVHSPTSPPATATATAQAAERPSPFSIVVVAWAVLLALGAVIVIALRATRW